MTAAGLISMNPNGGWTPGTITPNSIEATKAKAGGAKILLATIGWTTAACIFAGHTHVPGGSAGLAAVSIVAGATKVKCDSKFAILSTDTGTCTGTFVLIALPNTQVPCNCGVVIKDAGQNKVKGT